MNLLLDNIIFTLQHTGGISVVWQEHLRRIEEDTRCVKRYIEYPHENIQRQQLILDESCVQHMPYRRCERYRTPDVKVNEPTIFHSSYFRVLPREGVRNVTTVHDLTYHYYRHGLAKMVHLWEEEHALKHSDHVICISENTRRDLLQCYPWLRDENVSVVYNGVSTIFQPLSEVSSVTPFQVGEYLLFVGNRQVEYKRFDVAVAVARQVGLPLVFVGSKVSDVEREMLNKELGETNWYAVNDATSEDINVLYNGAFALLYPSDYEGFGLPVIEAQRAGCPVIGQRSSSIPEVGADAILLAEKENLTEQMSAIVQDMLSGRIQRSAIIESGKINAERFNWDESYRQVMNIYSKLSK